jgi:S-adenosylmethionine:tRNA ribosyltransferase-isomerase
MQEPVLTLKDFDFQVPDHLIAQEPLPAREASRLLIRSRDGMLQHATTKDLTSNLPPRSLLIFNDSKVIASRMFGRIKTGAQIELFLLSPLKRGDDVIWKALGKPLKKLHEGTIIFLSGEVTAEVLTKETGDDGSAFITLRFTSSVYPVNAAFFEAWLDKHGYIPLPPYIKRDQPLPAPTSADKERYQTIYAREPGSVAAPTAGLHFSSILMDRLKEREIAFAYVCLHVGAGTFLPVKSPNIVNHRMHSERFLVPSFTTEAINKAKNAGAPVIAVGTTSFRALESLRRQALAESVEARTLTDRWLDTDLFIYPKSNSDLFRPKGKGIDALITNFHQPNSTLFMLISALIGLDQAKAMYAEAALKEYRFFSYGDACLLWL